LLEVPVKELEKKKFKKLYGTVIEDIDVKGYGTYYYPIFLFRRLLYALCLIYLYEYPNIQLIFIILIMFPVIFFVIVK